jgi:hypothetical protein
MTVTVATKAPLPACLFILANYRHNTNCQIAGLQ